MRPRHTTWLCDGGATAGDGIRLAPMEIREVMTESVVTAAPDATVRHVAELMRERNVGSVVLVDGDGLPIGFITDRDLAVSVVADGHDGDAPAEGHATTPVVTGSPGLDVSEAVELMVGSGVRRLPIVDDDKRLVGVLSLGDIAFKHKGSTAGTTLVHVCDPHGHMR